MNKRLHIHYNVNEGVLSDEVAIEIEVKEMEIEELLGELTVHMLYLP